MNRVELLKSTKDFIRPRAAGFLEAGSLAMLDLVVVHPIDKDFANPLLPAFMMGRMTDLIGGAAHASFSKTYYGDRFFWNLTAGFIANSAAEVAQGLGILPGTYDNGDFIAYAVGAALWGIVNYSLRPKVRNEVREAFSKVSVIRERFVSRSLRLR